MHYSYTPLRRITGGRINRRIKSVSYARVPLDPSQLMKFIGFDHFWVKGALADISTSTVPNYHFRKRLVVRDMSF